MSQADLGRHIGVSFQQIQKYENGTNRIGPSRLIGIAEALGVPVAALFDAAATNTTANAGRESALDWLTVSGAVRLLRAYTQIPEGPLRRRIVDLLEEIAKMQTAKHE